MADVRVPSLNIDEYKTYCPNARFSQMLASKHEKSRIKQSDNLFKIKLYRFFEYFKEPGSVTRSNVSSSRAYVRRKLERFVIQPIR